VRWCSAIVNWALKYRFIELPRPGFTECLVRGFLRVWQDYRLLWRQWVPLVAVTLVLPFLTLLMPVIEKRVIDQALVPHQLERLPPLVALYALVWLASAVLQIAGSALNVYLGERLTLHSRERLFSHCTALSLAFSRREHSGQVVALFLNDAPKVAGLVGATITGLLGSLVTLGFGISLMLAMSWQLAVAAAVAPPVAVAVAALVTRPLRPLARRLQDTSAELNQRLQESLSGLREIVAYGQERSQGVRLSTTLYELLRLRMRLTLVGSGLATGESVLSLAMALVILGFGGYLVVIGRTTLGTLVAMQSLFGYVYAPAKGLSGLVSSIQQGLGAADRLQVFFERVPQVREREGADGPTQVAGDITFDAVSFAYHPGEPVLRDISFTARQGELIALVGPSGAGKSTLVSLIPRFYDPTGGRVLLDGVDLRDLTLDGLRRHIAMVFQDTFLFATTIRENLLWGGGATSDDALQNALVAANAAEFVERLPQGLDTPVGERGAFFSEGQKQRLAIARALLRNPRILILDEPTSALDARSERLLQDALTNLMRGRTTFVIAHRLATVRRADRILVFDGGRIVEQGSHLDLLSARGLYRDLHDLQFATEMEHAPAGPSAALR
jgi:ATP-binding cassette, subfamily B, bacterial MsbA